MSMPGRRVRVAVVFGGRSTEHAISCVSAGSVLAALDPDGYEVVPVGITPRAPGCSPPPTRRRCAISGRELPRSPRGTAVVLPGDPTAGGLVVVEPGEGARVLHGVDVVFPVLHGAVRRGRHDPGPAGDGRPAVRGVRGARQRRGDGQGVHQEAARRRGPAGRAVRGAPRRRATLVRRGPGAARAAGVRQAGPRPVRRIGITRVDDWAALAAAVAAARGDRREGARRGGGAGPRDRVRRAGGRSTAAPPEASAAGGDPAAAGRDWYDFEAKYLDDVSDFDIPADLPDDVTGGCASWPPRRSPRWTAPAWPGSTSSSAPTARSPSTR